VEKSIQAGWVDDFKSVYDITDDRDFGTVRALHFVLRAATQERHD